MRADYRKKWRRGMQQAVAPDARTIISGGQVSACDVRGYSPARRNTRRMLCFQHLDGNLGTSAIGSQPYMASPAFAELTLKGIEIKGCFKCASLSHDYSAITNGAGISATDSTDSTSSGTGWLRADAGARTGTTRCARRPCRSRSAGPTRTCAGPGTTRMLRAEAHAP